MSNNMQSNHSSPFPLPDPASPPKAAEQEGVAAEQEGKAAEQTKRVKDSLEHLGVKQSTLSRGANEVAKQEKFQRTSFRTSATTNGIVLINSYAFLNGKYLLDILYNNYFIKGSLKVGFAISKLLDKGIIELIGPFGLTVGTYSTSHLLSRVDTGVITTYALFITLGLIAILLILFSPILFQVMNTEINGNYSYMTLNGALEQNHYYSKSLKIVLLTIFTTFLVSQKQK